MGRAPLRALVWSPPGVAPLASSIIMSDAGLALYQEGERLALLIAQPATEKDRAGWLEGGICAKARSHNLMRPSPGFL